MGERPRVVQGAYFSVVPPAEIRPLGPPILITSSVIALTTNGGLDAVWAGPAGPVGPVIVEPAVSGIGRGRNRRLAAETKKYVNNFDTVDRTPLPPNIFLPCSPLFPPSPALGRNHPPLLDILAETELTLPLPWCDLWVKLAGSFSEPSQRTRRMTRTPFGTFAGGSTYHASSDLEESAIWMG
jgi:hypothetical protein